MAALQLISVAWAIATGPLSWVLLFVATTWTGRTFAVAAILISFLPLFATWGKPRSRQRRRPIAVAGAFIALALSVVLFAQAPSGNAGANATARHVYADGKNHFRRFALGNVLPESDQTAIGFTLIPAMDRLFTRQQSLAVKRWATDIYRELESDPDFHALGSALPDAYDEFWNLNFDRGHSFLYIPPGADRSKPMPALIFFHGSGGNFKAYLWLLSSVARRMNFIVIAPSYGLGNWRSADVVKLTDAAISACSSTVKIDRDNLHVMGLSNGGIAVSQLLPDSKLHFRSYFFLSPVFDDHIGSFPRWDAERPPSIFVLTGSRDDRVPIDYVKNVTELLSTKGTHTTLKEIDADHFAFFSHREQVLGTLEAWLREHAM